jgi:hypothetical protein
MKLYEIHFTKHTIVDDNIITTTGEYQITAFDEIDAAFFFGQMLHEDEKYEIHIKHIRQV